MRSRHDIDLMFKVAMYLFNIRDFIDQFSKVLAYSIEYIAHVPCYDDTIIVFARKDMEIVIVS
jgi:hypothetical protein